MNCRNLINNTKVLQGFEQLRYHSFCIPIFRCPFAGMEIVVTVANNLIHELSIRLIGALLRTLLSATVTAEDECPGEYR